MAANAMPGGPGAAGLNRYAEAIMNNLNSVLIEGNMVRDPLIRSTPKGTQVCNFSIASNRYYHQDSNLEKETGFFEIEAWGKLADACSNQGRKGRGVRVVGRLKQDRWTGSDGKNHTKISIVAEHVEYRADFKKNDEAAPETENMVETVVGDPYEFSKPSKKYVEVEELEAVNF
jgi:single-strand DNA-binding protein